MFALSLSLSTVSATSIASIVETLLMSAVVLRVIEIISGSFSGIRVNAMFAMEVSSLVLLVLSAFLEIISVGFRSFSLGFRIFANVSAGHVLSDIVLVVRYLPFAGLLSLIAQTVFSYFVILYEFLVAVIQTGVFVSLTSVYAE